MRARIGTVLAEAHHVQGSIALGHRRETRHVPWSLVAVEGMEESTVQHRIESPPQAIELQRVNFSELNRDPTLGGLLSGDHQCGPSHVNAENRQPQRGEVERVLAGPATRIEHRSGESTFGCQTHYSRLRPADIPRRRPIAVRRIPGQPRHALVTGRLPTTERIVSQGP